MKYLVDTNVISELTKPQPNRGVVEWTSSVAPAHLYVSVISLGELRHGILRLPASAKRRKLEAWFETDFRSWFGSRLIQIDAEVADHWAQIQADAKGKVPAIDGLIAATARCHGLTIATRNEKDFSLPGLNLLNPWS